MPEQTSAHDTGSDRWIGRRKALKGIGGAAVLGTTGLAGCAGDTSDDSGGGNGDSSDDSSGDNSSGSSSKQISVVTFESSPQAQKFWKELNSAFEEETGITVQMDYAELAADKKISQLIQTGNAPELATINATQAAPFALEGQTVPVTEFVDQYQESYGNLPDSYRLIQDGEDQYVPLWTNPNMYWAWESAYEEAGVEFQNSYSWDEFLAVSEQLDSSLSDMRGMVVPCGTSTPQADFFFWSVLLSNSGQVAQRNSDGEIEIALHQGDFKQKTIEAVEYVNELHQYGPEAANYGWGENIKAFVSQQSAHMQYPPRAKLTAINNREDVADKVKPVFPVQNSEPTHVTYPGGWTMFKEAENLDAARKFIEFVAENNRLVTFNRNITPIHNYPVYEDIPKTDEFKNDEFINKWFSEDLPVINKAIKHDIFPTAETDPVNLYAPSLLSSNQLAQLMYNVNIDGKDIETAVEDTGKRLESTLSDIRS